MGDGLLALFGVEDSIKAAEDSVSSAIEMSQAMDDMQPYLQNTYGQSLQIGIGMHYGELVIGTIDDSRHDKKMVIDDFFTPDLVIGRHDLLIIKGAEYGGKQ